MCACVSVVYQHAQPQRRILALDHILIFFIFCCFLQHAQPLPWKTSLLNFIVCVFVNAQLQRRMLALVHVLALFIYSFSFENAQLQRRMLA